MRSVDIKFTIIYHIQGEIQTFLGKTPILISGYDLNIFEHVCRKGESAIFLPANVSMCSMCSMSVCVVCVAGLQWSLSKLNKGWHERNQLACII